MSTDTHDAAAVQHRLWDEIEKRQIGMLAPVGAEPQHFQPMTAFLERSDNRMWFFTYKDTDLAEAVANGAPAMFVFQDGREFYACVGGQLRVEYDRERMNRYWNALVAAWYPEGKDDPRLTMLCLEARDAEVWIAEGGPLRYVWEIVKANATHATPEVGGHTHLNFH
ncbi:pyridoxamine 5'-phosphate oxidase family protein [Phenylobacterium sp. LjRoot225]|uniref:pyridoxamine 5'-phosphate oxidase family protein n=1 Tax=Phenylobacterium sp. LjRoot225 TaxID=3342285 RepID=UPI003ECCDF7E